MAPRRSSSCRRECRRRSTERPDHGHRPCLGAVHQPDGRAVPRPLGDATTRSPTGSTRPTATGTVSSRRRDGGRRRPLLRDARQRSVTARSSPRSSIHYEYEIAPDIQVKSRTRPAPGDAAERAPREPSEASGTDGRRRGALGPGPAGIGGASGSGAIRLAQHARAGCRRGHGFQPRHLTRGVQAGRGRPVSAARQRAQGRLTLPQLEAIRRALRGSRRRQVEPTTRRIRAIGNRCRLDR